MKTIFLAAFLFVFNTHTHAFNSDPILNENKTLMAIFAHPDDETLVGPVLRKYADRGVEVILIIVTDGRLGVNDLTDLEAGDELAAVRRDEMACAANLLGAELIHLNYEDQLGISEGHNNLINQSRGILEDLHSIIEERQPDAIITFGPDGFSNHMDHRLVGVSVTQVVLSKTWGKTPNLYYVGIPSSDLDDDSWIYMGVDKKYLTLQISFSDEEAEIARQSALCHASQFSPEVVNGWFDTFKELGNTIYFRPFVAPSGKTNSFFD